ncbi:MAG TPA: AGE family epimerase/isomerase [Lacunisphaera sp.]|nr:AGE family epimerase/isomerase [Lacunisphaera sp.]
MKPTLLPLLLALAVRALAGDGAAPVPANELRAYRADAERELRENILPFWLKHARDPVRGGFHSFIGEDMTVQDDQPRGSLLTARILWTFSAAYRRYHDLAYLEMARWALRDLREHFIDRDHGGLYWTVSPNGQPVDAHKQIYVQVFGIYGLSEYYRATGEQAALDDAIAIYRLVDQYASDPVHGGYFDSLDRAWHRPAGDATNLLGAAPKSQNSHIHILEGFTGLLRSWPDAGLRRRQRELVELMLTKIIDPRTHHLVLFMRDDWTPIGDAISYGHDIELSWLLVEAATVLGDADLLARAKAEAVAIARVTPQGIDTDGGVFNEGSPRGITNSHKEWWEQAEAAVGFLNAYQLSDDPQDLAASRRSWRFIQDKVVDRVHGDWHNTLERDGTPIMVMKTGSGSSYPMAKVSLWKCPYHNSRCCLELMARLDALAGGKAE